jgi:hypothetical protein
VALETALLLGSMRGAGFSMPGMMRSALMSDWPFGDHCVCCNVDWGTTVCGTWELKRAESASRLLDIAASPCRPTSK